MSRFDNWDRLIMIAGLFFIITSRVDAYIDPGTGSVLYTVGLGPVLIFLAWFGRRILRLFIRPKEKEDAKEEAKENLEA